MTHGMFDCIGLPLQGWDNVRRWVWDNRDSIRPHLLEPLPRHMFENEAYADAPEEFIDAMTADDWRHGRWVDSSGAEVVVNVRRDWAVEAVPSLANPATTRITNVGWVHGTEALAVDVVDADGEMVGRFAADVGQWRYFPEMPADEVFLAAVTGLAFDVQTFVDEEAFHAAPDMLFGDNPPMIDGKPARSGVGSFFPTGMFETPMDNRSLLSGRVLTAETRTNTLTGVEFHAVQVRVIDAVDIHLVWPPTVSELPPVGSIVTARATLQMTIPDLWERHGVPH